MDDKTVEGWLGFFGVVWRMALGELQMKDCMVRVRSADDLHFILSLMVGCRGKVSMLLKKDLPAWQKVYVNVVEMAGMVHQAVELAIHKNRRPAGLAPGRLIQGFKKIQMLAAYSYEAAVNPASDGGYENYDELLADVVR